MNTKEFGQRVRQYRERRGFTQEAFSEIIGLSPNYLSGIERGVSFPRYDKLIAIMNALDVSADELFQDVINNVYTMIAEARKDTEQN